MIAPPEIGKVPYPLLARFNRWCNRRFFEWAAGLTEEEHRLDRAAFFGSIHNTVKAQTVNRHQMIQRAARDNEFDRLVSYRYMSGQEAESPIHVIFLTLFNHHAHHRGQIHCMVTQAGFNPEDSDVIDYLEAIKQNPAEA